MMKILQIGPIPPEIGGETTGGVATHVWGLSTHLAKRGHEVAILADNFPNTPEIPVVKDGVRIYSLSKALILKHLPSILPNLSTLIKLKKHFKGLIGIRGIVMNFCYYDYVFHHFSPDVIHVHHLENRFPFAYFGTKGKIPIVTSIQSFSSIKFLDTDLRLKYHQLIKNNLELARNLIVVSKFVERELSEFFPGHQCRYWVVNDPVDIRRYYPLSKEESRQKVSLPKESFIVLFVGNLHKLKGPHILLKATKLLKEMGTNLLTIIVGDGPEKEALKDYVAKNHLEAIVRLEGPKNYPDLLYYYNSADLLVMPGFAGGLGIVYFEAMLCGTPVIGTEGITDEAIPSEDYGSLVPPNDARALAEAIKRGLKKKWDKEKIMQYASTLSWDGRIAEFEKVYESISQKNSRKREQ